MLSCVVLESAGKRHIRLFNLEDLSGVLCCGRSTSFSFNALPSANFLVPPCTFSSVL